MTAVANPGQLDGPWDPRADDFWGDPPAPRPTPPTPVVAQETDETDRFLRQLWPNEPDGHLSFFHIDQGGKRFTDWADTTAGAAAIVARRRAAGNIWIGCCTRFQPLPGNQRGGDDDCKTIPGLWLDVDYGTTGHASVDYPATEADAHRLIARFPLPPTMVVHSGNGLQAWWLFDEPADAQSPAIKQLLADFAYTWEGIAGAHGLKIDNVSDLARIMRIPGGLNYKSDPPKPVRLLSSDGPRYTVADLDGHLITKPTPQERPQRPPRLAGDGPRPGDRYNDEHTIQELLGQHGWTLVARWGNGDEQWRHPRATNATSGTIYADTGGKWFTCWTSSVPQLVACKGYDAFGLYAALHHGGDHDAAARHLGNEYRDAERDEVALRILGNAVPATPAMFPSYTPPAPVPVEVELPPEFWDTPQLAHILAEAVAAGCNEITVLVGCVGRVNAIMAPRWRTGRARGINPGSLNTFICQIGPPGAGKTRHLELPRDLIPHPKDHQGKPQKWFRDRVRPGSAAGLGALFEPPADDDAVRVTSACFEFDEGSHVTAIAKRPGEPIVAEFCAFWAGSDLSIRLKAKSDSRDVPAGSYGGSLTINLQTDPAIELLASAGIGLPQRFLWGLAAPRGAWDPDAWDTDVRPVQPVPWAEPERIPVFGQTWTPFTLPDVALRDLHALTNPDRPPLDDPLDVHHPYLQSKLACGLAGLHGRSQVTDEDWWRAGVLVDASAAVRRSVAAEASIMAAGEREAKRRAAAGDAVAAARAIDADRVVAARSRILAALRAAGADGVKRRDLTHVYSASRRGPTEEALSALTNEGLITQSDNFVRLVGDR